MERRSRRKKQGKRQKMRGAREEERKDIVREGKGRQEGRKEER